ncbi:MAG: DUF4236 domain-containing protein [Ruminococcus sp.]|nr:DUF4236 domain-containing protein [Ruminococcus sp.]
MGLNFRKSFKIGKFLKINKNKKGMSVSVGGKKLQVTLNDKKKLTASLLGTGISYDTKLDNLGKKDSKKDSK